jgi:hypothetical protein
MVNLVIKAETKSGRHTSVLVGVCQPFPQLTFSLVPGLWLKVIRGTKIEVIRERNSTLWH